MREKGKLKFRKKHSKKDNEFLRLFPENTVGLWKKKFQKSFQEKKKKQRKIQYIHVQSNRMCLRGQLMLCVTQLRFDLSNRGKNYPTFFCLFRIYFLCEGWWWRCWTQSITKKKCSYLGSLFNLISLHISVLQILCSKIRSIIFLAHTYSLIHSNMPFHYSTLVCLTPLLKNEKKNEKEKSS